MEERQHSLTVSSEGKNVAVSNGLVMVKLILRDGGYVQEFHALDSKGEYQLVLSSIHKDLIPSSEHRACASPMISGARGHLFTVCRESLQMVFSQIGLSHPDESRVVVLRITVEAGSNIVSFISSPGVNSLLRPRPVATWCF